MHAGSVEQLITEKDFKFMSSNGLNAVRVPVGWWIAKDPSPPKPFVGAPPKSLTMHFHGQSK